MEDKLGLLANRVGQVETKVAAMETRLAAVEVRLANVETRLDKLSNEARAGFRLLFGALIAATLGLAGLMAKGFHWI